MVEVNTAGQDSFEPVSNKLQDEMATSFPVWAWEPTANNVKQRIAKNRMRDRNKVIRRSFWSINVARTPKTLVREPFSPLKYST